MKLQFISLVTLIATATALPAPGTAGLMERQDNVVCTANNEGVDCTLPVVSNKQLKFLGFRSPLS